MSARDVIAETIADEWMDAQDEKDVADAILAALRATGYVVAKVPDECDFIDSDEDDRAFENGWNACRAALLASPEETP